MNSRKLNTRILQPVGVSAKQPPDVQDFQIMNTARKRNAQNNQTHQVGINVATGISAQNQELWPTKENRDLVVQDAVLS